MAFTNETQAPPQSFSRWYLLFLGMVLTVCGIAGLVVSAGFAMARGGLITSSVIFLVTAIVSLWCAFAVQNPNVVRLASGVIGALYMVWGIVYLFSGTVQATLMIGNLMSTTGGFMVLLGAIGLASALVPASWLAMRYGAQPQGM